jgi:hypothetical protein
MRGGMWAEIGRGGGRVLHDACLGSMGSMGRMLPDERVVNSR